MLSVGGRQGPLCQLTSHLNWSARFSPGKTWVRTWYEHPPQTFRTKNEQTELTLENKKDLERITC